MECLTLLAEAHAAGLIVLADGERLVVRGPRAAEALARQLLDAKADVLAALANIPTKVDSIKKTGDARPEQWRERTVVKGGRTVQVWERVDPPQEFPWLSDLDFDDLPEPWRP